MKPVPFKTCPNCKQVWPTMEDFLSDPEWIMNGYQVHFDDLEGGLFVFTHVRKGCYTTLAIKVKKFICLTNHPILNKRTVQPAGCTNLCMREGALEPCPIACECSWVREILQIINTWPKAASESN